MNLRGTLRRAAGLLVELPDEPELPEEEPEETPQRHQAMSEVQRVVETLQVNKPVPQTKTVEQIVRDADGPNLDQIKAAPANPTAPPILNADGTVNYSAIYQAAKLPAVPFTAEQVLEMVNGLPAELPLETKRQTVRISISAMGSSIGATPENIVADTSRKLAALTAYTEYLTTQTNELVTLAELEIQNLQEQMAAKQKLIESARTRQENVVKNCAAESDRLDDILEFFSLDVPPSKYAPPTA